MSFILLCMFCPLQKMKVIIAKKFFIIFVESF